MLNSEIRRKADYQRFHVENGIVTDIEGRMLQKLDALKPVIPKWHNKTVLDIGCDFGFWSFLAAQEGAAVLGIDRSRSVKGIGHVDIPDLNNQTAKENNFNAEFIPMELGYQWHDLGQFDITLMMSLYHHVYQNTGGDHESIWYWLRNVTKETLIWENPTESVDSVVQLNVNHYIHPGYTEDVIRFFAEKYFNIEFEGPALHETTRTVWKLTPKNRQVTHHKGVVKSGAGGATKAFTYNNNRRICELNDALGVEPIPGSMNVFLDEPFKWESGYYRIAMLDVKDRSKGLDSEWGLRPLRLYPVSVNNQKAWVMRFEGEKYPLNFVELISDKKLNTQPNVVIEQWQ